jgi:hypothetical protein
MARKINKENKMSDKSELPEYERIIRLIIRSIVILAVVGFSIFKLWKCEIQVQNFDYLYFLSTVLAIFAIVLSTLFYFKSTDQSNQFYNSTFSFTKDISVLLAKIESGFGERLKNIEEGYKSRNRDIEQKEKSANDKLDEEKKELEEKRISIESYLEKKLLDKGISPEEIKLINNELTKKNEEYAQSISEVKLLKNKLQKIQEQKEGSLEDRVINHLLLRLRAESGLTKDDMRILPRIELMKYLNQIISTSKEEEFFHDAIECNIIDHKKRITPEGLMKIKGFIKEYF